MSAIACPYCEQPAQLVRGEDQWPKEKRVRGYWFWACEPCDARVGCHRDKTAYGLPAKADVRYARHRAHSALDRLWMDPSLAGFGTLTPENEARVKQIMRRRCYLWLADILQMPDPHIGKIMDVPLLNAIREMAEQADPVDLRRRYPAVEALATASKKRQSRVGRRRSA